MSYAWRLCLVLALAACSGGGDSGVGPAPGNLRVTITTVGQSLDLDGYSVGMGDVGSPVAANDTVEFRGVITGRQSISLSRLSPNCAVVGSNPIVITIEENVTTDVGFLVSCMLTGVKISTVTDGNVPDPDGYILLVDNQEKGRIGIDDVVVLELNPGSHQIVILDLAGGCVAVDGPVSRVQVTAGELVSTVLKVTCEKIQSMLMVTTSTVGTDLDPDGYVLSIDGATQPFGLNSKMSFHDIPPGPHIVELLGVAENCTVDFPPPTRVDIPQGGTLALFYDIICARKAEDLLAASVMINPRCPVSYCHCPL